MMSESRIAGDSADRSARRRPWSGSLVGGTILILLGLVFLLQNLTSIEIGNWWALFILIPAVFSLRQGIEAYQSSGRWTRSARGPLLGAVMFTFVAAIFLLDLDWGKVWPGFLIIAGLFALFAARAD